MIKRLRIKFVCIIMLIVTIMLCVCFGVILQSTKNDLENKSIEIMQSLAENPFQTGILEEYEGSLRLPYFTLQINAFGDIFAVGGGYFDLSNEEFLQELITTVLSSSERYGVINEYNLRYLWLTRASGQCLVFVDMTNELNTLQSLISNCLIIGLLSLGVFFFISILLANWAVKPVAKAWQQQQQFVADASHELKTPLAVISTNAELLQQPGYNEDERCRFSDSILSMSRQMRQLVEGLLELARADSGRQSSSFSQVDFSKLVESCLLPFEPVFFESDLQLSWDIEPGIKLNGNEQQMRQLVDILLDNARKYSLKTAKVQLLLRRQGRSHCLLSLTNPGEELSKEELENIFKRFYRLDKARSPGNGYGLGLPIAEGIVKEHGGKIWAESRDGLICFNVELPREKTDN